MDRVKNERGEITKTIEETINVQTRWCKRVACPDWADEVGIEPSDEEARCPALFCAFHEWKGAVTENRWMRENEIGLRSTLNKICNDDLLETELDIGMKRSALGRRRVPTYPTRLS